MTDALNEIPSDVALCPSAAQMQEVEALANELKRLLVKNESALEKEGIREQVEILERWMESYRRGLKAAYKLSENGSHILSEVRDRLKLASEELQRLEGEGGNPPATTEQAKEAEDFTRAAKRMDVVIQNVEHLFHKEQTDAPALIQPKVA